MLAARVKAKSVTYIHGLAAPCSDIRWIQCGTGYHLTLCLGGKLCTERGDVLTRRSVQHFVVYTTRGDSVSFHRRGLKWRDTAANVHNISLLSRRKRTMKVTHVKTRVIQTPADSPLVGVGIPGGQRHTGICHTGVGNGCRQA